MTDLNSWGRYPRVAQTAVPLYRRAASLPQSDGTMLPRGLGRSYGDACLNDQGTLLLTPGLDRLIAFDPKSGLLTAEAGLSLADLLDFAVPRRFFPPVTPGTRFVTLGGAVANDIHGKNHHGAGTIGRHVTQFELLRSDGTRRVCSPHEHSSWFEATIGGLGLTGLMTWIQIQLLPIENPFIALESIKFKNLDAYLALDAASKEDTYTVAWIDTAAKGAAQGRGLFLRGNHAGPEHNYRKRKPARPKPVPFDFPEWVVNPLSMRMFNKAYYAKQLRTLSRSIVDYEPYFYPLDAVLHWNRGYGKRGFLQHQSLVKDMDDVRALLDTVARYGQCSFLTVLKRFGDLPSPGMLSFPRPGLTLTMDFPVTPRVLEMCDAMDAIVMARNGALYPAKDARMSAAHFQQSYPRWQEFAAKYVDPAFSSSFWRRVTGDSP